MAEEKVVKVLALLEDGARHRYREVLAPVLGAMAGHGFDIDFGGEPRGHQVVLAAMDRALDPESDAALVALVAQGGAVLAVHETLAAWARGGNAAAALFGWAPGEPAPVTELTVRPAPGTRLAERMDAELPIHDHLLVSDQAPPEATLLLTAPWHYGEQPLAFSRPAGPGRAVHFGLGHGAATWRTAQAVSLLRRALLQAAGLPPAPPLGVGLLGFGAIGREHAESALAVPGFELRGIADRSPARREEARAYQVPVHAEAAGLLGDPAIDLVVVGVPPVAHAEAVLEVLAAGRHAVCEKPFALRVAEVDAMLEAADRSGRLLTVYQSRRWDPDFVALRDAVAAGRVGDAFYMESFIGGFGHPCSYWHSHEPISGGTIYDWGSHYFDWMLTLFPGPTASVRASAHKRVWHDVSNADQVRVDVEFADGREATFMQSDVAAALKPKWYLLGTGGAITGDWRSESVISRAWTGDLVEERLAPSESPAVVTVHTPDGAGGVHREQLALPPRARHGFYRNLGDHLLGGEPLAVPPSEPRRNVAVMEAATRSIASGAPVEVRV